VPVGLVVGAIVKRRVDPGRILTFDDVDIPESKALTCWRQVAEKRRVMTALHAPLTSVSAAFFSTRPGAFTSAVTELWHGILAGQEMLMTCCLSPLGI